MEEANHCGMVMRILIDREGTTPVYRQIVMQFREMILDGRLPEGSHLPPERVLAQSLGVNRTTVVNAYRELSADGLVEGHVGRGTIVLGGWPPRDIGETSGQVPFAWTGLIAPRAAQLRSRVGRRVADLMREASNISLAAGVPEGLVSPSLHLEEVVARVMTSSGKALLDHSPTMGSVELRMELARRMVMKGCSRPTAHEVMVLSGSQHGVYLVAQLLLEAGDVVVVESPTYLGALDVFRTMGVRVIGVPVDEEGMDVEVAERILSHVDVRLIYTIPNFQNPTGATMSVDRRASLLRLAQRYRIPILEDDPYGELYLEAEPSAPMRALDELGTVLYLGSLSPMLGSGLRIGWLVAPSSVVEPLTALRQSMDLHPTSFVQAVVHELMTDGTLDSHMEWVRQEYARRRGAMEAALREHMPATVTWLAPEGGLYFWCSLPESVDSQALLEEAVTEGVVFVPGEPFFPDWEGGQFMRLSFVGCSMEEAEEGVRRLAKAVRRLEMQSLDRGPTIGKADRPLV
jgi:DNA-binding transcriptional MocR family regulator